MADEMEIRRVIQSIDVPAGCVRLCSEDETRDVLRQALTVFVEGNPRAWWLSLRHPAEWYQFASTREIYRQVCAHIPPEEQRCWFIPETGQITLPVLDVDVSVLDRLIENLPLDEYYVLGKQFDWLMIENDHNQLVICRPG